MSAHHDLIRRLELQEQALLDLLGRVQGLERALAFETVQREHFERLVIQLVHLPKRMDRIESLQIERRTGRSVGLSEGGT